MTRKVKVAIFDKDLKATLKEYPLNSDGTKIQIVSGGEGHFMPSIDNESFIELPYRSLSSFWKISYQRVYFAMKWSRQCVNFHTPEVQGPDPKQVMNAARAEMIERFGKQEQQIPTLFYIMLLIMIGIALKVFGVIG